MSSDGRPALLDVQPWASGSAAAAAAGGRRCILFSIEVMKARKLQTGAPVAIAAPHVEALARDAAEWCIGAAWPSFSLTGHCEQRQ